jgi:heptosyltransferase-1
MVLVHGSSRDDKLWPREHWLELGRRLIAAGFAIGLPHGDDAERERSESLAGALGAQAQVWPRLDLGALADRLAGCAGAIGVDSGLSHIAVALGLAHVQLYNFDTAWRTGPSGSARQCSVFAQPTPSLDAVWQAWQRVRAPS